MTDLCGMSANGRLPPVRFPPDSCRSAFRPVMSADGTGTARSGG